MHDAEVLILEFVAGRATKDDLKAWTIANRGPYSRPIRPDVKSPDVGHWIDQVSDWEIRARELQRVLSRWAAEAADQDSARAIPGLIAICEIGSVLGESSVMGPAFMLGTKLRFRSEFAAAAVYFELAERGATA